MRLLLVQGFQLCLATGILSLSGSTLSTGFLLGTLLGGSSGSSLCLLLAGLGLSDSAGILTGSSLGGGFLPCQFLGTLPGSLLGSLALGLSLSTGFGAGYLFGYHSVDLCVQFGIALLLLVDDALNGLLLFLQRGDHLLLLYLLVLERTPFLFTTIQQGILLALRTGEFLVSLLHLRLHRHNGFALSLLIGSILSHEAQAAIHLREILGAEDKQHLALDAPGAMHIAHGLLVALLTIDEFLLQHLQLRPQRLDVHIQTGNVMTDGIDGLTLVGNLVVNHHQVLQAFLHILLVGPKTTLLLFNLLSDLRLLALQAVDRYPRLLCRRLFFLGCLLSLWGSLFGSRTRLSGGCPSLRRRLTRLLSRSNRH